MAKTATFRSSLTDVRLLLWKNFLIQWRHPLQSAFELLLPCALVLIVALFRHRIDVQPFPNGKQWDAVRLDAFDIRQEEKYTLMYTPDSVVHEQIMNETLSNFFIPWSSKLNVFKFNSSTSMIDYYLKQHDPNKHGKVFAGIEFLGSNSREKIEFILRFTAVPKKFEYSPIRMSWETLHVMPELSPPGPREKPANGGLPGYVREGFLLLQHHLTLAIAKIYLGDNSSLEPDVQRNTHFMMQRFPFPPFVRDAYLFAISILFPAIVVFSFIYPAVNLSKSLVVEKEKRLKESMKMMGLSEKLHWIAYWIKAFVWTTPSMAIIVLLLTIEFKSNLAILNFTTPTLLFFFFVMYELQNISLCFAISSFFSRANLAGIATGTIFFLTFAPFATAVQQYGNMNKWLKLAHCLMPNTNMGFGIYIISMKESRGVGATWRNVFEPGVPNDILSLASIMGMQILNSCIYLTITWYMNEAFPGEYGVPKVWYFPLTRQYWTEARDSTIDDRLELLHDSSTDTYEMNTKVSDNSEQDEEEKEKNFETEPKNLRALIKIENLSKSYDGGRSYSVRNLSLNMYEGQITALLGHNGAGKTTTISILTGLYNPTQGTAYVNEHDIRHEMSSVRASMGICPQFNVLFDELTVEEHLEFYSKLKKTGLKNEQILEEVTEMIEKLDLVDKRRTQASKLSGGQQRKLSVGIALIGRSRVVFLDEPTSGMDVSARRFIWDLLLKEKQNRCILITTHFMEEADILGDRIAIMADGQLCCCGSPLFLKKRFGTGYHLTIAKAHPDTPTRQITETMQSYISECKLESSVGLEVTYSLPEAQTDKFADLFKRLETDSSLNVENYAISVTTMEEVFLKVGEYAKQKVDSLKADTDFASSLLNGQSISLPLKKSTLKANKNSGFTLFVQQLYALFLKKILYIIRSPFLTFCQLFIPFLMLNVTLLLLKAIPRQADPAPLWMSLQQFSNPYVKFYYDPNSADIAQHYRATMESKWPVSMVGVPTSDEYSVLRDIASTDIGVYNYNFMISSIFRRVNGNLYLTSMFNNQAFHTPSIALKHTDEAYLRYIYNITGPFDIKVQNFPLPLKNFERLKFNVLTESTQFQVKQGLTIGMAALAASFAILLVKERITKGKHLQKLTGVSLLTYWTSYFVMDMVVYMLSSLLMVFAFTIYHESGLSEEQQPLRLLVVFFVHGFAILPFVYSLSFMFDASATAYARLCLYITILGLGTSLTNDITSLQTLDLMDTNRLLQPFFKFLVPIYDLTRTVSNLIKNHQNLEICDNGKYEQFCGLPQVSDYIKPCCRQLCESQCFDYEKDYFAYNEPAIGSNLLSTVACGALYWALLIAIELQFLRKLHYRFTQLRDTFGWNMHSVNIAKRERAIDVWDDDVAHEKNRINQIFDIKSPDMKNDPLIVRNLVKRFGTFTAVDNISYSVKKGECFGMLGVNGAGKTTTFKMITGDDSMTSGDIFVNGKSLRKNTRAIQRQIGYCPQFDALLDDLTGRECLFFYARLRGIAERDIPEQIESLSRMLYFEMHLDKRIDAYSGGSKRKLSTALALIGEPCISFLDEPTTGVDPVARRCLWEAISAKLRDGASMVLTSHSMEECEALCQRLVIMVNGQICCIGSPLQLKNKFGKGYTVLMRVSQDSSTSSGELKPQNDVRLLHSMSTVERSLNAKIIQQNIDRVKNFMSETFSTSVLKAVHNNVLHYCIDDPDRLIRCSEIFEKLESSKTMLHIEDYTVCQTNLEQIFLTFARMQYNGERKQSHKLMAQTSETIL